MFIIPTMQAILILVVLPAIGCGCNGTADSVADTSDNVDSNTEISTDSGVSTDNDTDTGLPTDSDTETALSTDEIEKDWVTIPAAQFVYGSPETQPCRGASTEDQVNVIITRPYKMSATEITRTQWSITGLPDPSNDPPCDDCPQGYVNWFDVLYWLNSLSRAAGLPECYNLTDCVGTPAGGCLNGMEECIRDTSGLLPEIFTCTGTIHKYPKRVDCPGYRLPTAAEWEWAARGGTTTATYNGEVTDTIGCLDDPVMDPIAWYCGNSDETTVHPVAQKQPNAYGLYDILGNIGEWVSDAYTGGSLLDNQDSDTELPLVDPVGKLNDDIGRRPLRGGSVMRESCRSTATNTYPETREVRAVNFGFRPVRTLLD